MDDDLLDIARTIRPYLPKLIGEAAAAVDLEIAALLAAARSGRDVKDELVAVLVRSAATRVWMRKVRADGPWHRPPELQPGDARSRPSRSVRGTEYKEQGGDGLDVDADKYVCPEEGDYAWWRSSLGDTVPPCPYHGCRLEPA